MSDIWYATLIRNKESSGKAVEWAINNHCNLRCKHCYMEDAEMKHQVRMSTSAKLQLAERISTLAKTVIVSGGEPMLESDLFEVLSFLTSRGCRVFLATNGTRFQLDTADKIIAAGLTGVQISIDSHDEATHDAFRGIPGSWGRSVRAIKALLRNGVRVAIGHTVHAHNYTGIRSMIDFVQELGIAGLYILRFLPCGEGENNRQYVMTPEQEKEFMLELLLPHLRNTGFDVNTNSPEWNLLLRTTGAESVGCSHGHVMFVNFNGDVYSCPMVDVKVGNALEQELEVLRDGEQMHAFRDRDRLSGGDCALCPVRAHCGGCYAASANTLGGIYERGECWVYRDVIRNPELAAIYLDPSLRTRRLPLHS